MTFGEAERGVLSPSEIERSFGWELPSDILSGQRQGHAKPAWTGAPAWAVSALVRHPDAPGSGTCMSDCSSILKVW